MKILIFFTLLMVSNISNANVASNFNPDLMIKLNDINEIFNINFSPDQADFLENKDSISNNKENYFQFYTFVKVNQMTIKNTLMVAKDEAEAERYYNEFQAGIIDGLSDRFNFKKDVLTGKHNVKATFYTLLSKDNLPQGNFIIIKKDNRVYDLLLSGMYFESFTQFNEFLKHKVDMIFLFNPEFEPLANLKIKRSQNASP